MARWNCSGPVGIAFADGPGGFACTNDLAGVAFAYSPAAATDGLT